MNTKEAAASLTGEFLPLARRGDQAALGRMLEACRGYLSLLAEAQLDSWMQSKVGASDLVQQTFMDAYRAFSQFEGKTDGEWLAWLRRILTHNATDFVRSYRGNGKRDVSREVRLDFPLPAAQETPSHVLLKKERALELADALSRLSPDQAEVVRMRSIQRLPFDVIAERMRRSRPAAQMLWMRAIQQLRARMEEKP